MTTDGTRIRRALENLHAAANAGLDLHLTDKETEALSQHINEFTAERTPVPNDDIAIAFDTQAIRERDAASAEVDRASAERDQARPELRDLTEINRVLTFERDAARTERNTHHSNLCRIIEILHTAGSDDTSSPLRNRGVVEAIAWLVDDWRIERGNNEADTGLIADLRNELGTVTKERHELAQALANPRRAALREALKLAPRPGPLTGPSTADVLRIADWLLTQDEPDTEPEPEAETQDLIPDVPTFDTTRP